MYMDPISPPPFKTHFLCPWEQFVKYFTQFGTIFDPLRLTYALSITWYHKIDTLPPTTLHDVICRRYIEKIKIII